MLTLQTSSAIAMLAMRMHTAQQLTKCWEEALPQIKVPNLILNPPKGSDVASNPDLSPNLNPLTATHTIFKQNSRESKSSCDVLDARGQPLPMAETEFILDLDEPCYAAPDQRSGPKAIKATTG